MVRGCGSSYGNAAGLQHLAKSNGGKLRWIDDGQCDVGGSAAGRQRAEEAKFMRAEADGPILMTAAIQRRRCEHRSRPYRTNWSRQGSR